jgi:group I intron endonuclease
MNGFYKKSIKKRKIMKISLTFILSPLYLLIWEEKKYTLRKKKLMQTTEQNQNDTTNEIEKKSSNAKCCGIYGLRNKTNGKWYIGQSKDIQYRFGRYGRLKCKSQRKLFNSLSKYGYDGFDKIILERCGESMLNEKEIYWIKHFNAINEGYNLKGGGNRGKYSDESKRKIGEKSKGRKHSPETIEKIKRARANQPSTPMNSAHLEKLRQISMNRIVSQETREKMRLAHLGHKHSESTKQKMRDAH